MYLLPHNTPYLYLQAAVRFYVPVVQENGEYEINFRTIAVNCPKDEFGEYLTEEKEQQLVKLITKVNGNTYGAFCYAMNNYDDYTFFPATFTPERAGVFILETVFKCHIADTRLRDAINLKKIADEALMRALMYKVDDFFVINKADMTQRFLMNGGFEDEK